MTSDAIVAHASSRAPSAAEPKIDCMNEHEQRLDVHHGSDAGVDRRVAQRSSSRLGRVRERQARR